MKNIPYGVKIIALILIISGCLAITGAFLILTPILEIIIIYVNNFLRLVSIPFDLYAIYVTQIPYLIIYSLVVGGLGIFSFIITIGLVQLKNWGYRLSMIVSIPAVAAIVGIAMIWFLTQDDVKDSFNL